MADSVEVARIRAYLETHLKHYHWEALRDKLIAEGHDPEAVELALTQVEPARAAIATEHTARTRVATLATVLTVINVVAFGCFMPYVGVSLVVGPPAADRAARVLWWGLAPILAGQIIALAVLFLRKSPLARPLLSALLPSLALALLLFGSCVLASG
ncbi:MAG TPA: hypothetical protein VLA19_05430 [Herpetosiphonaceae bacterium]|nr:hypothetical protein [Herpetosiphonaceae bacterium]